MFTRLIVQVTDTAFPKVMVVPITGRITLGRSDIDDPMIRPDVDFVACNAIRNGISRIHAAIDVQGQREFILTDLGSRNGTRLNGMDLESNQPYFIEDGDRIQFGRLQVTIYFE